MILEHYNRHGIAFDPDRKYEQRSGAKPRGFWVSVKGPDDWPSFLREEGLGVGSPYDPCAVIELAPDANVLHLKTEEEVLAFGEEFKAGRVPDIDWVAVAEQYDGIIIAPYQWELRLDDRVSWYYPWDVASGCIWNLSAIESVIIKEVTTKRGGQG